jgi:short subunit fatty acids transporter
LSSLSNKTILHNEKIFKIIGSIILILIIAVVVFLYFMSTPLPEGQQGAKAEELTDKIQQPSIKQLGIYRRRLF